jgi:hypothetical protein
MPVRGRLGRLAPLLGILLVAAGWALSHQVGSDAVFDDCRARGGGFVVLVSLLGLAIAAAGGLCCLLAARRTNAGGQRVLAQVGALLSLVAGFAIVLQLAAGLILAACWR